MIINVRGSHGVGKSTLLMPYTGDPKDMIVIQTRPAWTGIVKKTGKEKNYPPRDIHARISSYHGLSMCVLGQYHSVAGGLDEYTDPGIHDYFELAIQDAAAEYDIVLFEGVTVSSSYSRYMPLLNKVGGRVLYISLPFDQCLSNVRRRNAQKAEETGRAPRLIKDGGRTIKNKHDQLEREMKRIQGDPEAPPFHIARSHQEAEDTLREWLERAVNEAA